MSLIRVNGVTLHTQILTPTAAADPTEPPRGGKPQTNPTEPPRGGKPQTNPTEPPRGGKPQTNPIAVLLHGLTADSMASWYFTVAFPLVEAGYRVVLLDMRGHGRSERPPLGYALTDFVNDLDALLGVLDGDGPYLLLGNSFGGTVAFGYACRHPNRVAGIVAIESSPPTPAWFARLANRLTSLEAAVTRSRTLVTVGTRHGRGGHRARETARMLAETSLRQELPASPLPPPGRITAIGCPVLCLYGERSHVVETAAETVRLLPQTDVRVFAGQRHSLLIDQPADVWAAVSAWLPDGGPHA